MGLNFIQDFTVVLLVAGISGAIARRLGASATIGYLLAGMVVGPYTPPVDLVSNIESIQVLSQLGLIFLMFSTGMGLSFRKLGQLGMALFVAVLCSTLVLIVVMRTSGLVLGIPTMKIMFIAGMLSSSSSAIISRILHESGFIHHRFGQMAMTITLLEDLAALILFSIVGSYATATKTPLVLETGTFFAFMTLAGIISLLVVPRFLASIQKWLQEELQTLLVAGALCLLAILAARSGYSPALGAFLLGVIIAGTPQRSTIERTFSGLRDVFSAVFFVSIGMLIDVRVFFNPWLILWLLLLTLAALAVRLIAATSGMFIAGYKGRDIIPAALTVTVTGEFSFIFAQLGVERGVLPDSAQAIAVGVCILTAVFTSIVVPRSERVAATLKARQPRFIFLIANGWQNLLASINQRGEASAFWRFGRNRVWQVVVEILFVSGLLHFADPLYNKVLACFSQIENPGLRLTFIFWSVFGVVLLLPLIAIWRNISTLAILYAQTAAPATSRQNYMPALIENLIKLIAIVALTAWLSLFWPKYSVPVWIPVTLVGILAVMVVLLWRKMIYWHSVVEGRIYRALRGEEHAHAKLLRDKTAEWNVNIGEAVLLDLSPHAGHTIAELNLRARFGCSIIAIERQGHLIMNPRASVALYPQDKLLLLGDTAKITAARELLSAAPKPKAEDSVLDDIHFETSFVPEESSRIGQTLTNLKVAKELGVQIIGIKRDGKEYINPTAEETLQAQDEVLVLGLPSQIKAFERWLQGD